MIVFWAKHLRRNTPCQEADCHVEQFRRAVCGCPYAQSIMYARMNAPIRPMGDREVFEMLQALRVRAQNMKLDMTDAMEEYCGTGYEKNMGVMDKNRFRSTMGTLFAGMISQQALHEICQRWKAGHPDPDPAAPPGSFSQVKWKQFASA